MDRENLLKNILNSQTCPTTAADDDENIMLETDCMEPTQGVLSNTVFFELCKEDTAKKLPKSLFMKINKAAEGIESYNLCAFYNEAYFYSKIVPFFETFGDTTSLFHAYLGSSLNVVGSAEKCALLAENLQAAGYRHRSPKSRWDYPHLAIAMQTLGEFHAFSYKAKSVDARKFYSLLGNLTNSIESIAIAMIELLRGHLKGVLEKIPQDELFLKNHISSVIRAEYILENMLTVLQKQLTVDPEVNENLVLIHGDPNNLNLMFQYENGKPTSAKLFDFAGCKLGDPSMDILYFLYCATDQRMRDDHWDDLIDLYYTALSTTFRNNVIPTKSSIINKFSLHPLFSGLIGMNFAPYVMAIDEMGEDVPEDILLSDMVKIGERKSDERICIFKDMVRRNLF